MVPIFFTLITLVISCSSSIGNELDRNRDGVEGTQNDEIKMEFVDLNADILYLILNRLELNTLINMAQVDSRYVDIVNTVFRHKFPNYKLCISYFMGPTLMFDDTYNNQIVTYNIPFALNMLKYFGHDFQSIEIRDQHLRLTNLINICQFTSKYCSKSLKNLV